MEVGSLPQSIIIEPRMERIAMFRRRGRGGDGLVIAYLAWLNFCMAFVQTKFMKLHGNVSTLRCMYG